jgi:hypothetical protein
LTTADPAPRPRTFRIVLGAAMAAALLLLALLGLHADSTPLLVLILALAALVPAALGLGFAALFARASASALANHPRTLGALAALTTLGLAYAVGVMLLDRTLAAQAYGDAYADCRKVWSTRGLVDAAQSRVAAAGNTPATVKLAFARGAPGVEVDIYYDPALADFVVAHDFPYELKDGVLLMLDELLAQTDPTKHYWLDFKRHGRLSRAQAEAAAVRLAAIAERAGIARARLWVEGTEPFNLMPFVHAGFRTIFDVHPPADSNPFTPLATQLHKAVFLAGGFTVMGMNYGSQEAPIHGPVARQLLGDIPVFLYHVPTDRALLAELVRIPQVRVVMPGDHSADVYDIDACSAP